jgi:anaerobic ribonucleoside-triphosphate reductase activating protein
MKLNLYQIAYPVTSLGPGQRVVIWVAGCRKRCVECISPEIQDPGRGKLINTDELANHLLNISHTLDGLTISGGEPFDQAAALSKLILAVKKMRSEWSVIVYSGYCLITLKKRKSCRSLLENTDVLIDGPFRSQIPSTNSLTGSGNQYIHFLSSKFNSIEQLTNNNRNDDVNIGYGQGCDTMLIGVFSTKKRKKYHKLLTEK